MDNLKIQLIQKNDVWELTYWKEGFQQEEHEYFEDASERVKILLGQCDYCGALQGALHEAFCINYDKDE
jgi:hypothetical protein